jgi:glucose-1-phosphate cytidylyltransferase
MVEIGGRPILWHIMNTYAHHGFRDFVLCLGYKGEVIKEYFFNYALRCCDFTVDLRDGRCDFHGKNSIPNWRVALVDTGQETLTGGRVKRIRSHIDSEDFFLTYGDGVTDLNIADTLRFHRTHGKIGTVTGVAPPSRYGELFIEGDRVLAFQEKPKSGGSINGGYFVFNRRIFERIADGDRTVLEREPLESLAQEDQLRVYPHNGFWQCMDTYRDYRFLEDMWASGKAPWAVAD